MATTRKTKGKTEQPATLSKWEEAGLAPQLTDREKVFRRQFVEEYLKDYSPYLACLRLGFASDFASDWARKFMGESYVLQQISERENTVVDVTDETIAAQNKQRVMTNLWRESQYTGPGSSHAARVAASAKLAQLFGMEAPIKTETKVTVETPVQFYIPDNGRDNEIIK